MNENIQIDMAIVVSDLDILDCNFDPQSLLVRLSQLQLTALKESLLEVVADKDGGPQIGDLHINHWHYDISKNTGRFRMHFAIERQFCCSDIESCVVDYVDFTFVKRPDDYLIATAMYFNWSVNN
ncbi:hypothetical protein [Sphingobacterium pedocola]|uniref:Uncharacterized protein n=1 Tax=Sphingobacterium pedocola TaxID=2082722 RepID=A0ABR9T5A4_9SPHI|nr:hypothetical protein [Sphingobacterium pedocola]MBE8720518.1 hypothetical protein [Sphingobacterium pedocola]